MTVSALTILVVLAPPVMAQQCECTDPPADRIMVAGVTAAPGASVVPVPIVGQAVDVVKGYSFAIAHTSRVLLASVEVGADILSHGAELVLTRIDNDADPPFGSLIVVLDSDPPLGDVPPIDISECTSLATFTYALAVDAGAGESIELLPGHHQFGEPPMASVFIDEQLDSIVPSLCPGSIRVEGSSHFLRGDCNRDGRLDLSDAVTVISALFRGVGLPLCLDACDSNDDGRFDISDAIYTLLYQFVGGSPPPEPYPLEGPDPTPDLFQCGSDEV